MKYWSYLALKIVGIAGFCYGLLLVIQEAFRPSHPDRYGKTHEIFLYDFTATCLVMLTCLLFSGLLAFAIRDQRRRCRTCLRKLIMPVSSGDWGNMLIFGRPQTAWICPYGHGTMRIENLQITGKDRPDWEAHGDNIWKELESYGEARK